MIEEVASISEGLDQLIDESLILILQLDTQIFHYIWYYWGLRDKTFWESFVKGSLCHRPLIYCWALEVKASRSYLELILAQFDLIVILSEFIPELAFEVEFFL
jgi:hypothetical protein